ncbi:MAG TPA: prolyl oligopeptidase family serine peptidase [Terriglobia bacterium]|nr:prolyl oligopeptidase family serine peptidase [Terriglobia bacterium]
MNRREFVTRAGAGSLGLTALPALSAVVPGKAVVLDSPGVPDMVVSSLSKGLNNLSAQWDRKRQEIKTPEALLARNRFVRQKFIEMIGGLPEKTPVNPTTVKVLKRDRYSIEVLMFQSRPDFWVTASLYVPSGRSGPFPGVISPCGHYGVGRTIPTYQAAYLSLVKNGFVVLAYDPIGQGERRHYWNPETGRSDPGLGDPVFEHSMAGQLLLLMGESLTQYRVWDGMRAIDYLLTRQEVDPEQIGCAGHSGGGTLTKFISMLDERVKCAVVHEGGTANRWPVDLPLFSPLGPSDAEQNVFPAALYGIDHVDQQIAIAPRPLLASIEHRSRSFNDAAASIESAYRLLGVPERFSTVSADNPHAWTYKLRLATMDWFSRWFYGHPGPISEPALVPEKPEDLYCTPNGSIRYSQQGQTIWSLILKKQATLPPDRPAPTNDHEVTSHCERMRAQIQRLLHYQKNDYPLNPREIVTVMEKGYKIEKLEFLSEPGIYLSAWAYLPETRRSDSPVILYFNEQGVAADGMEFAGEECSGTGPGVLAQMARSGHLTIAVDVRGIGETRPPHVSNGGTSEFSHLFNVETAMAYMAWYMNQSLIGQRVQDLQRSVDYALSRQDRNSSGVWVIGKGMGASWALYAAALDPRIKSVVCHGGLLSYRSLTATDRYLHGADVFVLDVLNYFDLPQVAAAVAGRRLSLLSPMDPMQQPVDTAAAAEAYRWTQDTYIAAGARDRFHISTVHSDQSLAAQYLCLLGQNE